MGTMKALTAIPTRSGPASAGPCDLSLDVLRTADVLSRLKSEWDELFDCSSASSLSASHAWQAAWWNTFQQGRELHLLAVRNSTGELVGLAPLGLRTVRGAGVWPLRRLEFLATGEDEADEIDSDYLDFIIRPGWEPVVLPRILRHLSAEAGREWDEIVLRRVHEHSPSLPRLREWAGAAQFRMTQVGCEAGVLLPLPATWPALVEALESKSRRDDARKRRLLDEQGAVAFRWSHDRQEFEELWPTLVDLHQRGWQSRHRPGCFASPLFTAFHRQVGPELAATGHARIGLLTVDGRPRAACYLFVHRGTVLHYQFGMDAEGLDGRASPGHVLLSRCLEAAIAEGLHAWDFLHGTDQFKLSWSRRVQFQVSLRIACPGIRESVWQSAQGAARLGRRWFGRTGRRAFSRRNLAANILSATGAGAALRRMPGTATLVGLTYHRVGDLTSSLLDRDVGGTSIEAFADQVRWAKRHFDVIRPADIADVLRARRGQHLLITFDDGYRDNYEVAFPILQMHNVPATFFVSTDFFDRGVPAWWDEITWMVRTSRRAGISGGTWFHDPLPFDEPDRKNAIRALLAVYRSLAVPQWEPFLEFLARETGSGRCPRDRDTCPWMDWDMLRAMHAHGMTIGGHTMSHAILSRLGLQDQQREIGGCARRLEAELGAPMKCFSYPDGQASGFNAHSRACLANAGVEYAFSCHGRVCDLNRWDPYDIPRVSVEVDMSPRLFRAILTLPRVFA
jgi:CelD/BcsL family acetyltransferase involved in cellulose biosynthesis/peptidoglycan/xylan/chitin deacetylase (PgdA/CDA1 family)